jgi:hypothetical protein
VASTATALGTLVPAATLKSVGRLYSRGELLKQRDRWKREGKTARNLGRAPGRALGSEAMVEYLKEVEPIFMLLLGWLLGLFTLDIGERIRRRHRRRDLTQAVVDEILSLQHTMAVAAYQIRARYADVPDAFLDKILLVVEGYQGPDRDENLIEGLRESRSLPQGQRAAVLQALRKPDVGTTLWQ